MANSQRKQSIRRPIAICISDIHYNLNTLSIADVATRKAIETANELNVPLIIAGDMHDSKANMRGECVNSILETIKLCKRKPYIIVGNHSRINEKSQEHSLNFLEPYALLIDSTAQDDLSTLTLYFISYQHNTAALRDHLKTIPKGATLIMHQGISGSNSGEYIQDKSAITPKDVAGLRVISGHYHTRQTIDLPDGGKWDYIGNPYSLNFAEANDPPKGFQILMDDGSLEFVPTNLRKHVVLELDASPEGIFSPRPDINSEDLVWIKLHGTKENLAKFTKNNISAQTGIDNFRLDLIPVDDSKALSEPQKQRTQTELLDDLVDATNATDECKTRLKQMWRDL